MDLSERTDEMNSDCLCLSSVSISTSIPPSSFCFASSVRVPTCDIRVSNSHCSIQPKRLQWTCRKGRARTPNESKAVGRGRGGKRLALYDAMTRYVEHFQPLLQAELDAEQLEIKLRRDASLSQEARVARGDALYGLVATKQKRIFSNEVYVLSLRRDNHTLPPNDSFAKGDLVDISLEIDDGNEDDTEVLQGVVLSKSRRSLFVTFSMGSEADRRMKDLVNNDAVLKAERGTNTLAFDRAVTALNSITEQGPGTPDIARLVVMTFADREKLPKSSLPLAHEPYDMFSSKGYAEDDEPFAKWNSLAKEGVSNATQSELNIVLKSLPRALNGSQRAAIKKALSRRLTLLQGPPGTGKTLTAGHIIACAVRLGLGPVLGCASSNVATDNLMRKVVTACDGQSKVIRIGRVSSIGEDLWENSMDGLLERNGTVQKARDDFERGLIRFSDLYELQKKVTLSLLQSADVLLTTCVGSAMEELAKVKFGMVLIDEATQATETDALISLSTGSCIADQVVLVGDHHQLPPTTLSDAKMTATDIGLETSLFLRLWSSGVQCELLDTQYRMHPDISRFPSKHFYMNRLKDGVHERDRPNYCKVASQLSRQILPTDERVVFCNVEDGVEESDGTSFFNEREGEAVVQIVHAVMGNEDEGSVNRWKAPDIGIISPYSGQVKFVRDRFARHEALKGVEVNTVDGFQGREKNVVIVSAVRSNNENRVGFLNDWRRLNVSITRARCVLVVVANSRTMMADKHWAAWIRWVGWNGVTVINKDNSGFRVVSHS